jgi:hypothetical protein
MPQEIQLQLKVSGYLESSQQSSPFEIPCLVGTGSRRLSRNLSARTIMSFIPDMSICFAQKPITPAYTPVIPDQSFEIVGVVFATSALENSIRYPPSHSNKALEITRLVMEPCAGPYPRTKSLGSSETYC